MAKPKDLMSLAEIVLSEDYIISGLTAKALKSFLRAIDNPDFLEDDWAEAVLLHVDKTIIVIRDEAAKDLGLKFKRVRALTNWLS